MNKYQEAYKCLSSRDYKYASIESVYEDINVLGELVERATPKKPLIANDQDINHVIKYACPTCGNKFIGELSDYCYRCGQRFDWSGNND